jgi:hypothetical protein
VSKCNALNAYCSFCLCAEKDEFRLLELRYKRAMPAGSG